MAVKSYNIMENIQVSIVLEDQFSKCTTTKTIPATKEKFDKMLLGIGKFINHFDKAAQINFTYKVISVTQL